MVAPRSLSGARPALSAASRALATISPPPRATRARQRAAAEGDRRGRGEHHLGEHDDRGPVGRRAGPRRTAAPGCRRGRATVSPADRQPASRLRAGAGQRTCAARREHAGHARRRRSRRRGTSPAPGLPRAASASRRSITLLSANEKPPTSAEPVGERARQRQPARRSCAPSASLAAAARARSPRRPAPSTVRSAAAAVKRSPSSDAGEQHGPERHQVEQQDDADDVADDHAPAERGVGEAGGGDQQPERRRAQHLAERPRPDGDDQRSRRACRSAPWPRADAAPRPAASGTATTRCPRPRR